MNRVVKGFLISPLLLGFLMSLFNAFFGEAEVKVTPILIGTVIYSVNAYALTALLAVPTYFFIKRYRKDKVITYPITSIIGFILGTVSGVILMFGFNHLYSIIMFGFIGVGLSTIFWYLSIRRLIPLTISKT